MKSLKDRMHSLAMELERFRVSPHAKAVTGRLYGFVETISLFASECSGQEETAHSKEELSMAERLQGAEAMAQTWLQKATELQRENNRLRQVEAVLYAHRRGVDLEPVPGAQDRSPPWPNAVHSNAADEIGQMDGILSDEPSGAEKAIADGLMSTGLAADQRVPSEEALDRLFKIPCIPGLVQDGNPAVEFGINEFSGEEALSERKSYLEVDHPDGGTLNTGPDEPGGTKPDKPPLIDTEEQLVSALTAVADDLSAMEDVKQKEAAGYIYAAIKAGEPHKVAGYLRQAMQAAEVEDTAKKA